MKRPIIWAVCGWIATCVGAADKPSSATKEDPWTNSLGMKFVPVPETKVLFCIWETRVQDFEAFVKATGYDATKNMGSFHKDGFKYGVDNWKSPGFEQTPSNAVCGVSWEDAKAFCEWLTKKERAAGLLGPNQSYRLPTDAEWTQAAGTERYPWGVPWPPPKGAGNYAGEEAKNHLPPNPHRMWFIGEYNDGFERTAPVGSFAPNEAGLYDMGGNVWEWCEDYYQKSMNSSSIRRENPELEDDQGGKTLRVLRGASWISENRFELLTACRFAALPNVRQSSNGFRCVLELGTP